MQGLTKSGNVRRGKLARGAEEHAPTIASQLRARLGRSGAAAWRARAAMGPLAQRETGHDPATVAIAKAIQLKISKFGTKPKRFMYNSIPVALAELNRFVLESLAD